MIAESAIGNLQPALHTPNDVIGDISFDHMLEHAKLVVGFMTELGMQANL